MQKSQIQILLVDDDPSFGKATSRAIEKLGYHVHWVKTPAEVEQLTAVQTFQACLMDCMLPKTPGVELAAKISASCPQMPIILMSGIYKDKGFIRQAKQKTGCADFLCKPFTTDDLKNALEPHFQSIVEEEKDAIPRLFSAKKIRKRKIVEAIEESDDIHGYELPFIYSLFLNSGISGQLNVVEAEGELFGITFAKGKVVAVETNDPPTQLGEILVEKDLLDRDDIETEMAKESVKKIGQQLVQANLLSPHILDEILVEQMEIRMSNTVLETSIEVNFIEADEIPDAAGIGPQRFAFLLARWFENKVSADWLKSYYLIWLDAKITHGTNYSEDHELFATDVFDRNKDFVTDLIAAGSPHELMNQHKYSEQDLFLCLHLLAITKCVHFEPAEQTQDWGIQEQRLSKIYSDIRHKNYFEILNLSKNAKDNEIKRAYSELSKVLSPKLFENAPENLKELSQSVFSLVETAHQTVSDPEKRKQYIHELKENDAKRELELESSIEQAKKLLSSGQAKQALQKFDEAFAENKDNVDLALYRIWARLKLITPAQKQDQLRQVERDLSEVSSQAKQSALLHLIKGLFQKERGNIPLAKGHIENAVSVDPNFMDARRELNLLKIKAKQDKPVDLLRSDLKDVVGMLFKRK